jgi:methylglutaconyl-CoA hydratase
MAGETHLVEIDGTGVATVTLNRPELRNAFDDALIADLTATFRRLGADDAVRAVVLRGKGKSFSAGGDLAWMRRMAGYTEAENVADGMRLAMMLQTLAALPRPTIAVVHGHCFAGATGLVACCDVAIAAVDTVFAVSEVRLGLVPATIAPYVVAAIGARQARRYFLTAERFDGATAQRLGLVHEAVPESELDSVLQRVLGELAQGGPRSQGRAKALIADVAERPVTDALMALTARRLAEARASDEAKEGLGAFFEKRKPRWAR